MIFNSEWKSNIGLSINSNSILSLCIHSVINVPALCDVNPERLWRCTTRSFVNAHRDNWEYASDCHTCTYVIGYFNSGVFRGGGAIVRPPPWSDHEFLDNFCTVFVSFVSRLNRKIRVPRLMPVKNCFKVINLGTKKWFFSGEGLSPLHHTLPPRRLRRLVEILNTPLYFSNIWQAH